MDSTAMAARGALLTADAWPPCRLRMLSRDGGGELLEDVADALPWLTHGAGR